VNSHERGQRFRALHGQDHTFLMPNAWDPGSARMLAAGGFAALATTSAGIAYSQGVPDQAGRISRSQMLDAVARIAASVDLPVSADLESGYGETAEEVAETIRLAIQAGVVGCNIEDVSGDPQVPLFDKARAAARIAAARELADASGMAFTLTARTDCYLAGVADPFAEAVARCNLYRESGADCLFVPGIKDRETIGALVREINGPMTVVMGLSGAPLSVADLRSLGVRRVSIGGSLARATFGLIRRAAEEMQTSGTFSYALQQIPDADMGRFFASFEDRKR